MKIEKQKFNSDFNTIGNNTSLQPLLGTGDKWGSTINGNINEINPNIITTRGKVYNKMIDKKMRLTDGIKNNNNSINVDNIGTI